jgi:hypothetical protein
MSTTDGHRDEIISSLSILIEHSGEEELGPNVDLPLEKFKKRHVFSL